MILNQCRHTEQRQFLVAGKETPADSPVISPSGAASLTSKECKDGTAQAFLLSTNSLPFISVGDWFLLPSPYHNPQCSSPLCQMA